jgi:hypothetical protein
MNLDDEINPKLTTPPTGPPVLRAVPDPFKPVERQSEPLPPSGERVTVWDLCGKDLGEQVRIQRNQDGKFITGYLLNISAALTMGAETVQFIAITSPEFHTLDEVSKDRALYLKCSSLYCNPTTLVEFV